MKRLGDQRRATPSSSACRTCGGTHYGSTECPYRCSRCTVNTDQCFVDGCPRNARFAQENAEADERIKERESTSTPRRFNSEGRMNWVKDGRWISAEAYLSMRAERDEWKARYERPTAQSENERTDPNGLWVVWYEDPAKQHEVFFGEGSEVSARARYKSAYDHWSCHLLRRVPHGK